MSSYLLDEHIFLGCFLLLYQISEIILAPFAPLGKPWHVVDFGSIHLSPLWGFEHQRMEMQGKTIRIWLIWYNLTIPLL